MSEEEDEEIMALIDERGKTKKYDKERLKEVSKKIKKCIRDKKRSIRQEKSNAYWQSSKASRISRTSNQRRKDTHPKDKK